MEWPFKKVRRKVSVCTDSGQLLLRAVLCDTSLQSRGRVLSSPSLSNLMGEEVVLVLEPVLKY